MIKWKRNVRSRVATAALCFLRGESLGTTEKREFDHGLLAKSLSLAKDISIVNHSLGSLTGHDRGISHVNPHQRCAAGGVLGGVLDQ